MDTVLFSSNEALIGEFEAIATLANAHVQVFSEISGHSPRSGVRIFVDHEFDGFGENSELVSSWLSDESDVSLVLAGSPSQNTWRIAAQIRAKNIVLMPESREWLIDYLQSRPSQLAPVICLAGVSGGIGTTTLALSIARNFALQGKSVVLVDLNLSSVGLEISAGAEKLSGLNWAKLISDFDQAKGRAIIDACPEIGGIRILANAQIFSSIDDDYQIDVISRIREHCDLVVIDCGVWQPAMAINRENDFQKFVLCANTVRSCAVAKSIFARPDFFGYELIVRELPGSALSPISIAKSLDSPLTLTVPNDSRICELAEQGHAVIGSSLTKFNRVVSQFCQSRIKNDYVRAVA